jgi:hypothetical protein
MNNQKKYNLFIFFGTFTRSLVEVFVPIILYNKVDSFSYVYFFLLLSYLFSFILNIPLVYLSRKLTFKWLIIITSFSIIISYYYLFIMPFTIFNLVIIAITHVINAHVYWLSRHYFALGILTIKKISPQVGKIVILNQLALIPASYLGALLITYLNLYSLLLVIILLYIITVIPLFCLENIKQKPISLKMGISNIIKNIPFKYTLFFSFAQFRVISKYLFPLYIFLYVKNQYTYIGIFNIIVGFASMLFVYFFAQKMAKKKKDYLLLTGFLSFIVWILKLNILATGLFLIVGLMEGLVEKMYETAFNYNLYAWGKQYDRLSYVAYIEGLQSLVRVLIMLIFFLFIEDIKLILYISAFMLIIIGIIGYYNKKNLYE